jgi:hypothetical protein
MCQKWSFFLRDCLWLQDCLTAERKGGSTHFSLTLINRMENTGLKQDLKDEPEFGAIWHTFSSHANSSIYRCFLVQL